MTENNTPTCERCGTPMERTQRLPEAISFDLICPLPESACQAIAALRSEVEALRKRNEALEEFKNCVEAITEQITLEEPKKPKDLTVESLQVWMAQHHTWGREGWARVNGLQAMLARSESRAQELDTKLRAAEDAVVVLSEALWSSEGVAWDFASLFQILASSGYKKVHGEDAFILAGFGARPECDCWLCETLSKYKATFNTALKFDADSLIEHTDDLAAQRKREIVREALEAAVERLLGKYSPKCNSFFFERHEIRAAILNHTEPA